MVNPPAAPVPPVAPAAPAAPVSTAPPAAGSRERHMGLDAFYLDERHPTIPRADNPQGRFFSAHTQLDANGTPHAETVRKDFANPLNDPAQATVLPQRFAEIKPVTRGTQALFDADPRYWLYVSPGLKQRYAELTDKTELTAMVSVFFGVGPEPNLFGLRSFFAPTVTPVLVGVPGFESGWKDVPKAWGVGVSTSIIRQLLDEAGLTGLPFRVEVMAGYSTGYRGLNLTAINKLVDLTHTKRFVYLDAFYWHDDHPMPPGSHQFHKKLTVWAVDTLIRESPASEVFIVGYTHPGATPRNERNEPKGPLRELKALAQNTFFLDLEFKRDGLEPIADDLEKVCLARLLQGGIDDPLSTTSLPAGAEDLVRLLPQRGSLGVANLPGYTYFRKWRLDPAVQRALAGFPAVQALRLITRHKLLAGWSTDARIEFRHRDFVQEVGKELLLP